MCWPHGPCHGSEVLVEDADDGPERVHHQPLADEPGGVRQPVRESPDEQQQPRRADAVRAQDRHPGADLVLVAAGVDVDRAADEPVAAASMSSRTRARVRSSTPSSIAFGQCVRSTRALRAVGARLQAGARAARRR